MESRSSKRLAAHRDDRRFRELYRYFQPGNPAALLYPQYVAPGQESVSDPTIAVEGASLALATVSSLPRGPLSPNTTLTSFAQLAALRLNAHRAIIR
jgi:hypothetical protein